LQINKYAIQIIQIHEEQPFYCRQYFFVCYCCGAGVYYLKKTGGVFCYPLDDTFIHMAVAKNSRMHGNWGHFREWVPRPLPLFLHALLALVYSISGLSVYSRFLLSLAGALILIAEMQRELNRNTSLSYAQKAGCVLISLFVGAIPSLAGLGMEHTFQVAFTLLFVHRAATILTEKDVSTSLMWETAFWGACMVFTRYENAFVVAGASGLLFLQKKYKSSY
jgi:hypothetical protein